MTIQVEPQMAVKMMKEKMIAPRLSGASEALFTAP
jgi:hypothetical protein